ncbi:hypothetical protein DTL21_08815 [Bremerella cremea]|uniref:LTXXQ motif protein n=1 Tax=Blastopirellula marina TaxID=124 RepID=A0A2S8FV17_9BACT|nr:MULTISPECIES: hypothetical protein [Pirellulaceae]PQO36017.1 hypothetical protein C5Y83_08810 [Blastopirellula marina]RCS48694.1 hypothetical protein DTL21_08815 [Bremerella cremea]
MSRCSTLLMFALVALVSVGSAFGADEDAKPKKNQRKNANPGIFGQVMKLDLSEEQKAKVVAIRKEFGPKLAELTKAVGMTKEDRQARMAAQKEAKEKGLKGKEMRDYVNAKSPLTDEQQEAQKAVMELNGKIREKLASVLTDEQKEKLGFNKKKPGANKKKKAE